jgi:uncharacterized protein with LGFP repeats
VGIRAARAQDPEPQINPRASWENGQCAPRAAPAYREVKIAIVHHTVNANDYSPEQVPAMLLAICHYHRDSNGWNDIGYNFLVDRFGRLWEGRAGGVDQPVVGAHTAGMNTQSTGISNLGTFDEAGVTPEAMDAMTRLIRWKLPLHGQPTSGTTTVVSNGGSGSKYAAGQEAVLDRISGHRDVNNTDCPGGALYAQLPELRQRVAGAAVPERPAATVTMERPPRRLAKGTLIKVHGTIGPPKQSLSILLEKKKKGVWARWYGRTIPARDNGSWIKKVRFRDVGLYRVTALFGGDGANAPGRTKAFPVRVPRKGGATGSPPYNSP